MSARMYFFLFCMLTNINPNMNKLSWAINYTRAGWAPGCLELLLLAASLEATRHHIPQLSSSNIQTCSANCTNTFYNWSKYIFYFWQIHSSLVPLDTTFPGCPQATYRHSLVMSYLPSNSRSLPLIILSYLSSFFVLIFFDSSLLLFTANLCIPGWDFLEQIILSKCSGFAARAVCHEGLWKTTLEQDYAAFPSYFKYRM